MSQSVHALAINATLMLSLKLTCVLREEHCIELVKKWHELRLDLEKGIVTLTGDKTVLKGVRGDHKRDIFRGHCFGEGGANYTRIQGLQSTIERMQDLYHNM